MFTLCCIVLWRSKRFFATVLWFQSYYCTPNSTEIHTFYIMHYFDEGNNSRLATHHSCATYYRISNDVLGLSLIHHFSTNIAKIYHVTNQIADSAGLTSTLSRDGMVLTFLVKPSDFPESPIHNLA